MESTQLSNNPNEEALFELLTLNCEIGYGGTKIYRNKEGQLHREHGPAEIAKSGTRHWYRNGKLHRIDGPAVIYPDGDQEWWKNGELHREDGPAIIHNTDGYTAWCKNGKYHREDGPAVIWPDNSGVEYYIDGELLTKNEFQKWQKDNGIKPNE